MNCHESVIYILAPLKYATIYGCSNATIVLGAVSKAVTVEHCQRVHLIIATVHQVEPCSMFWIPRINLQHTFIPTNSLLLFKKLLMHMDGWKHFIVLALFQPINALRGVGKVFEPCKDNKVDLLAPKLVFH
ncbi:uncharacterized protein LOC127249319 [Andrographis paniculata]|uniref:uncharacterized protein LOC127249319 n=1 Tax=Andrographis paniculata TaxID=175694 RepID=UPI0021E93714|nr:uncharacterized protein LOC127249319 [Andrographis paniculata]